MNQKTLNELFSGTATAETGKLRLLALAGHLEKCEVVSFEDAYKLRADYRDIPQDSFTMQGCSYSCGAPACLVGHGLSLAKAPKHRWPSDQFASIYGVDAIQVAKLFSPALMYKWDAIKFSPRHITPRHAAAVLRHLVNTGEVDWELVGLRITSH